MPASDQDIHRWLEPFGLDPFVRQHVASVLAALPDAVRNDLMQDGNFHLCDFEPGVESFLVPMRLADRHKASRSVVLKRTLRDRSAPFVHWLIAHEFAHAHLRHAGRTRDEDPEHAADALAAQWGFPKPVNWRAEFRR